MAQVILPFLIGLSIIHQYFALFLIKENLIGVYIMMNQINAF